MEKSWIRERSGGKCGKLRYYLPFRSSFLFMALPSISTWNSSITSRHLSSWSFTGSGRSTWSSTAWWGASMRTTKAVSLFSCDNYQNSLCCESESFKCGFQSYKDMAHSSSMCTQYWEFEVEFLGCIVPARSCPSYWRDPRNLSRRGPPPLGRSWPRRLEHWGCPAQNHISSSCSKCLYYH